MCRQGKTRFQCHLMKETLTQNGSTVFYLLFYRQLSLLGKYFNSFCNVLVESCELTLLEGIYSDRKGNESHYIMSSNKRSSCTKWNLVYLL